MQTATLAYDNSRQNASSSIHLCRSEGVAAKEQEGEAAAVQQLAKRGQQQRHWQR